jgi:hypothetical protein
MEKQAAGFDTSKALKRRANGAFIMKRKRIGE